MGCRDAGAVAQEDREESHMRMGIPPLSVHWVVCESVEIESQLDRDAEIANMFTRCTCCTWW